MDKIQSMTVFVEIAERGSLTKAADALGKSLPSVVRLLAELEQSLQVRLFNRTTRRIALTEEGKLYLDRVRRILTDIKETESALIEKQTEIGGAITVTAPVRFGEMHVVPAITGFISTHPRVQVNLLLLDRVVNLMEEGIDVAVRIAQLSDSSLIARPVGQVRTVICASPALLKRTDKPHQPQDLSALPCVVYTGLSTGSDWSFRNGGRTETVAVNGSLYCNHIGATVEACCAGLGFGRFLCYQIMPRVKRGELAILLEDFEPAPQPINIIYPHARLISSRVRTFVDWAEHALQTSLN